MLVAATRTEVERWVGCVCASNGLASLQVSAATANQGRRLRTLPFISTPNFGNFRRIVAATCDGARWP